MNRLATSLSDLSAFADSAVVPLASTMSEGVRTALLALLGLLIVIFGCLIAFAFVLRKRPSPASDEFEGDEDLDGEEVIWDPMACPKCRREFDRKLRFCPYDATRLIPAPEMLAALRERRKATHKCPSCRRTFDGPTRFCPHDGRDLVPITAATRASSHDGHKGHEFKPHEHDDDTADDTAKICPECQGRYRYGTSFCGKDGVELVVLN